ncbi:hypothetical protein KV102_18345 [Mumia sp. zg.B53]|uniref:hypothetical protein n=1 Tax=unclassified Mumia TaxID=2621872 RepID=UPI001C6E314D|nr:MULTISPECIES: hypothetical protein [unclassified Mumia]MBW9206075.1 hypothetical protein [Mumia sp. zg.B17]MBW9211643.1 hypothetical protein [Mumia sp. zg.B21]MBW9216803.1 hypothetical protein [Mumia sp. zg.B53]MDD9349250.1 hypothetical protein [Mumia sp.]
MSTLEWILVVGAVVAAITVALSTTAGRLDRLHIRLATAQASLDRQLLDRSTCLRNVAVGGVLDPASALVAVEAADASRAAIGKSDQAERETALSEVMRTVFGDAEDVDALWAAADEPQAELLADLGDACERVQLAHRFHDDLVARTQRMRRKRIVRWARLAGYAPWPNRMDFDDTPPPHLVAHERPVASSEMGQQQG